ncbi:MAG: pentapeptide repeat-containing protein [Oscillospiraceae bacterium]|jgi:uncharacterized protein YjbI with pentapeptide repeats|nr:pentapeptide repeat-containing protein [Oscillospiraceae bacterium]
MNEQNEIKQINISINTMYGSIQSTPPPAEKKNSLKMFVDAYKSEVLFLENIVENERVAYLSDLYVVPPALFKILSFFDSKITTVKSNDIISEIDKFALSNKSYYINNYTLNNVYSMIILGQPGIGKSSIMQRLASDYTEQLIFKDRKVFCYRLRDLADWNINIENPLDSILKYAGLDILDIENSIMLLDGLDELCGIACMENSIDVFCKNLLRKCNKTFKIILTSRLNYIQLPQSEYAHSIFVELCPLSLEGRNEWITKYFIIHKNANKEIAKSILNYSSYSKNDTDENDFLGMPLSLYIIMSLSLNLSDEMSLSYIYDQMIEQLKKRHYDDTEHIVVDKFNYEELVKLLALDMFSKDKYVLNSNEVSEVIKKFIISDELSDKEIQKISSLYGISFYFKDGIPEKRSVEFIHRTLRDYVVAWKIYDDFCVNVDDNDMFWLTFDSLFTYNEVSPEIVDFLYERLKLSQLKKISNAFMHNFTRILHDGMIYSATRNINTIEKSVRLFYSYWRIMKTLIPEKDFIVYQSEDSIEIATYLTLYQMRKYPINLAYQRAKYLNLRGVDFNNCNFTGADFIDCDFSSCIMDNTTYADGNFSHTKFHGSSLSGSEFDKVNLVGCDFSDTNLSNAAFISTEFDDSTNFECANLQGVMFKNTTFNNTDFSNASLWAVQYKNVILIDISFSSNQSEKGLCISCHSSKFINCDMKNIVFNDSGAENCMFNNTDFSHSDIRFLCLRPDCKFKNMNSQMFNGTIMTNKQAEFLRKKKVLIDITNVNITEC